MQKREKRESREREIIEKTIVLLSQRGFLDVRMSDIASETGYSMGTIYSHFESKEDLLVASALMLALEHKTLMAAIRQQPMPAIEKVITMALCSWLISIERADLTEISNLSLMPSVWRRATQARADRLNQLHVELAGTFLQIVLEAIRESLHGYEAMEQEQVDTLANHLTHGMWGLCVGLASTAQSGYASTLCSRSSEAKYAHFITNYTNFLKGYGWQESDPGNVFERCLAAARTCLQQTTWFAGQQEQSA